MFSMCTSVVRRHSTRKKQDKQCPTALEPNSDAALARRTPSHPEADQRAQLGPTSQNGQSAHIEYVSEAWLRESQTVLARNPQRTWTSATDDTDACPQTSSALATAVRTIGCVGPPHGNMPEGWKKAEMDGIIYYYNLRTGQRSWHHPAGCGDSCDTPKQRQNTQCNIDGYSRSPCYYHQHDNDTQSWPTATCSRSSSGSSTAMYFYKSNWHGATGVTTGTTRYPRHGHLVSAAPTLSIATDSISPMSSAPSQAPPPTIRSDCSVRPSPTSHAGGTRRSIAKMLAQLDREHQQHRSSQDATVVKHKTLQVDDHLSRPTTVTSTKAAEPGPISGRPGRLRRGSISESVSSKSSRATSIPDEPNMWDAQHKVTPGFPNTGLRATLAFEAAKQPPFKANECQRPMPPSMPPSIARRSVRTTIAI